MTPDATAHGAAVDEYDVFCQGFRRLSGLDLTQYKRPQMERRIRSFLDRRGHADGLSPYLQLLRADPVELDAFLDRVTINVSELWRHPEQFAVLARHVLPELAKGGRVRCWSAGCSYGAEAYTLAAVCHATIPTAQISITGTDIDRRMVARAREARFSRADARGVPAAELKRYFVADGDALRPVEELRRLVRFETGDLLRDRPALGSYDLVMCRNTAIYFSEPVRDALHLRLANALRPGGVLVVGATERVSDPRACGLEAIHPFTYRRA
jgi:chemotaxis protein methyltransferase CheR